MYMMCGWTLEDLHTMLSKKTVTGLHPDLTLSALEHHKHWLGTRPQAIQVALPEHIPTRGRGLRPPKTPPSKPGEALQIDVMQPDFNSVPLSGPATKIIAHGGASYAAVCVDVLTGFTMVLLLESTRFPLIILQHFHYLNRTYGHRTKSIAADSAIMPISTTHTHTTLSQAFCYKHGIEPLQSIPYEHNTETALVENRIRQIKQATMVAIMHAIANPAILAIGFTKEDIAAEWGNLAHWAAHVINFRTSLNNPEHTCYTEYSRHEANAQHLRFLPILSVLIINRPNTFCMFPPGKSTPVYERVDTNKTKRVPALYVGPVAHASGAIHVAFKDPSGSVQHAFTTQYTTPTQGFLLHIHENVEAGLHHLLNEPLPALDHPKPEDYTIEVSNAMDIILLSNPAYNAWDMASSIRCLEPHNIYDNDYQVGDHILNSKIP